MGSASEVLGVRGNCSALVVCWGAAQKPSCHMQCMCTGRASKQPSRERGTLNKSIDYFGEGFGAEGLGGGVERGKVYCCTESLK